MISKHVIDEIRCFAEGEYPQEACGLVVGLADDARRDRVVPCRNVQDDLHDLSPDEHPETAREAYMMDRVELLEVVAEMENRGEVLKGIYHSHPDSEAEFSETDCQRALSFPEWSRCVAPEPADDPDRKGPSEDDLSSSAQPICSGVVHIVVSVNRGKAGDVRSFRWEDSSKEFVEVR